MESAGLRHELNEALEKRGGHCGYYVRPEYRGKGYATEIMAALKEEARAPRHEENSADGKL